MWHKACGSFSGTSLCSADSRLRAGRPLHEACHGKMLIVKGVAACGKPEHSPAP